MVSGANSVFLGFSRGLLRAKHARGYPLCVDRYRNHLHFPQVNRYRKLVRLHPVFEILTPLANKVTPRSAGLVVLGLGVGLGIQQPIIAAQTVFEKADLALATTVIVFIQGFSGTLFLSVAQNVFRGKIQSEIRSRVPGVNPDDVLDIGASDLISAMGAKYPQQLESILTAYNYAIKSVFTISLALACMSVIGSAAMEWRSVKKKKQAEAAKESKA